MSSYVHYRAILNHQGSFGQIQLTLRYATLRKRLIVIVSCCKWEAHPTFFFLIVKIFTDQRFKKAFIFLPRDLVSCSESGSDTYVRMYLLPDQTWKHRKRTPVKKKTVDPVFNETLEKFLAIWKPSINFGWKCFEDFWRNSLSQIWVCCVNGGSKNKKVGCCSKKQ